MGKTFSSAEKEVLSMFPVGAKFKYEGEDYTVVVSGKPTCINGEPKTDIYIKAISSCENAMEFKVSFKKENAEFLENKINSERAEQLFGECWSEIISNAISDLKDEFLSRPLIYKKNFKRTDAGSITLGWKFELLNKSSGQLSGSMKLTKEQVIDVYAGTNLTDDKRNSSVNGVVIADSGVANFILFQRDPMQNIQQIIDSLVSIEDYVNKNPDVYFACKALNYRSFIDKYDRNRPLAVYVDWFIKDGKLSHDICFDTPLQKGGNYVHRELKNALNELRVITTDDLNHDNVECTEIICE